MRITRETILESHRIQHFPQKVSRLRGLYCFPDIESAEAALSWEGHFRTNFLAELGLSEAKKISIQLDANWVAHMFDSSSKLDERAADAYWRGLPHPDHTPIWETLVEGRLLVLGTELREKAYRLFEKHIPSSTAFLELSRAAAWSGSDLGNAVGWMRGQGDEIAFDYIMDMRDAHNPDFLRRFAELRKSGHPIRQDAIEAFSSGNPCFPDFRAWALEERKAILALPSNYRRATPSSLILSCAGRTAAGNASSIPVPAYKYQAVMNCASGPFHPRIPS